jgi:phosphatidylglycerol:prolipoprotein diacylglycerol transferase
MYLCGFMAGLALGRYRARATIGSRQSGATVQSGWNVDEVIDLVFYIAVGVIAGGRLGYVLFYNPGFYLSNIPDIFAIWDGGMSFHGGLLGVAVAVVWYARKTRRKILVVADFLAPLVPPGLFFGRVGNFINQELWGRATEVPWGVYFHTIPGPPRHPSQLYEALLEGVILFIIVWWYSSRPRSPGQVSGLFLLGYGVFRFIVEFYREPDEHIGAIALDWVTMGQILSIPMMVIGLYLMLRKR